MLATDSFAWSGKTYGSKDGFELARRVLGSEVEDMDIDVMELSPERVGTFDLVLFLDVLYHLRHPLLALEKVASVTSGQLILMTHAEFAGRRPAMTFYPGAELAGDSTNWWGPNPAAVEAIVRDVGFSHVERVHPRSRVRAAPGAVARMARRIAHRSIRPEALHGRVVMHAWR